MQQPLRLLLLRLRVAACVQHKRRLSATDALRRATLSSALCGFAFDAFLLTLGVPLSALCVPRAPHPFSPAVFSRCFVQTSVPLFRRRLCCAK